MVVLSMRVVGMLLECYMTVVGLVHWVYACGWSIEAVLQNSVAGHM